MAVREQIILEGIDKTQKAFGDVNKRLKGIESNTSRAGSAFSKLQTIVVGAAAAIGAIKLSKDFLNTAVEVENLAIQLKFLTGSAEEGAKAMDILTKFAATVPFELQQIANAAPNLLTVVDSTDELNEMLQITGDIAAATGLSFKETAEQLQRSFSGGIAAADMFREKGVKALLGFEEGVRYNAEQTKELIVSSFRDGTMVMKGASADMADTFTGTMSMLSDKLFQFQKHLMDSGPFDFIKALLEDLNNFIDSRFGSIEEAAEVMGQKIVQAFQAGAIGLAKFGDMITPIVKLAANSVKGLIDMTNGLPATIKAVGIIGFMMLGIKGKLVVLAIGAVFDKVRLMFADIMDFMAKGKDKIAGLMEALGFDEVAKSMRTNADQIRASNQEIRDAINKTKEETTDDMEDIIISMGEFGNITAEEFEKAGPLTQALTKYFAELNQEVEKTAEIAKLIDYEDPIIQMGKQAQAAIEVEKKKNEELLKEQEKYNNRMLAGKKLFNELVTEAMDKEAKKQLFIDVEANKRRLNFHKLVSDGIIKHEEKMRKRELFLAQHNLKQKRMFHQLESEGVKKFNENNISYLQAYSQGFVAEIEKQKSVLDQLRDAGANAFHRLTDALTDFVMTGKFKFKDFANMIIRELVRIAAQAAVTFAIKKAASAFGGPFGFLAGFLADGGPAQAGKPYVVGEKGPELFVPNQSGQVIANEDMQRSSGMGLGKEVVVNFNVTAIDADSFQSKLAEQRDTIVGIVNEAVTNTGRRPITA